MLRNWFPSDIENIVRSVLTSIQQSSETDDFKRGFLTCAVSIITAIGGDVNNIKPDWNRLHK